MGDTASDDAFLVPMLRLRPVNLIDVWDPGEVLRMMRVQKFRLRQQLREGRLGAVT